MIIFKWLERMCFEVFIDKCTKATLSEIITHLRLILSFTNDAA